MTITLTERTLTFYIHMLHNCITFIFYGENEQESVDKCQENPSDVKNLLYNCFDYIYSSRDSNINPRTDMQPGGLNDPKNYISHVSFNVCSMEKIIFKILQNGRYICMK